MKPESTRNSELAERLRWMMLGWGVVIVLYFPCAWLQGPGSVLTPSRLDRLIPYSPWAVWPYLSFFLLIPYAYLRCDRVRLPWLAHTTQLVMAVCAAIYLAWPSRLAVYPAEGDTPHWLLLRLIVLIDTPNNCLPSLHAALSLLAVWALWQPGRLRNIFWLIWFMLISLSIIMLRRHLFIDWLTGSGLAIAAGLACRRWLRVRNTLEKS